MSSELRLDLFRRIRERHYDWARDSTNLYEMGELSARQTAEDILTVTADFLVKAVLALNVNEADLFQNLHELIERRRKREAEAKDEL
jgi:hypothetical protein